MQQRAMKPSFPLNDLAIMKLLSYYWGFCSRISIIFFNWLLWWRCASADRWFAPLLTRDEHESHWYPRSFNFKFDPLSSAQLLSATSSVFMLRWWLVIFCDRIRWVGKQWARSWLSSHLFVYKPLSHFTWSSPANHLMPFITSLLPRLVAA